MNISKPKVVFISGSWPSVKCGVGDYLYKLTSNLQSSWAVITSKEAKGKERGEERDDEE